MSWSVIIARRFRASAPGSWSNSDVASIAGPRSRAILGRAGLGNAQEDDGAEGQGRDRIDHEQPGVVPGRHHTGELVTGHVRQGDVGVVTDPAVPVAAAQPGRLDPDHGTVAG